MPSGGNKNQTLNTGRLAYGKDASGDFYPILINSSGGLIVGAGTITISSVVLGAGTANIGDVDVLTIAAGDNNIGNVDLASAIPAGTAAIGKLAANSGVDIGDVDILSIAAGSNNIGDVDIASAIPAGTSLIGKVSIDQVTANANEVVLKAGTAAVGKLAANSGVDIGDVDVLTEPSGSGSYTTPTHSTLSAGTVSAEALASNTARVYALLINDSDASIYIKLGAAAVLNQGIRLNSAGGSYEMSKKLGNLYTGAINGISSAASKVLLVTEGV